VAATSSYISSAFDDYESEDDALNTGRFSDLSDVEPDAADMSD
jgi:hypothetical protein